MAVQPNSMFTELAVATIKNRKKEIADNMSAHNALYRRIKGNRGGLRTLDGGESIVENLEFAENETYQRLQKNQLAA